MRKSCLLFMLCLMVGCTSKVDNTENTDEKEVKCTCPRATVYLQPYDNFTQNEALSLKAELETQFDNLVCDAFEFQVLPNKKLDSTFYNDAKTRYRADKIIKSLNEKCNKYEVIIALTHKDVSIPYKGHDDWGVLGLSLPRDSYACVTSDYRLKHKKRDLWKVALHEFTHTYYKYSHCPDDNPECLMKDAKGKADFSNKHQYCATCKNNLFN